MRRNYSGKNQRKQSLLLYLGDSKAANKSKVSEVKRKTTRSIKQDRSIVRSTGILPPIIFCHWSLTSWYSTWYSSVVYNPGYALESPFPGTTQGLLCQNLWDLRHRQAALKKKKKQLKQLQHAANAENHQYEGIYKDFFSFIWELKRKSQIFM